MSGMGEGAVEGILVFLFLGYDMSPFIRRYARYLNEKALSYRTVAFDFCKVKRGDLIRLFACYNDGIINLLEKYFDMNKKQCKEALDIYKKFLIRMDRVAEFLKVAEFNTFCCSSNQKNIKSGVSALSSTSNAFGNVVANGRFDTPPNGIDENLKLQILAEEEAAMNQFKVTLNPRKLEHLRYGAVSPVTNPVISNGTFVSENNFASVFGNTETKASNFDALGGVLQPMNATGQSNNIASSTSNNNVNNNQQTANNGLLTGDLESSLASLAENLTINNRTPPIKGVQWNSPKNGSKQGNNWTPQPISATTGVGYKPMNQSMGSSPFSSLTATPIQPQMYPQPILGMRPLATSHTVMAPISAMGAVNPTSNQMGQSLLFH
ncbi:hypothetical protein NQ314_015777 [Rhamnusium bicolor]|uniref:ENTH domain-containing protein n=1 Tax=Rhamnusium bicolor TaxID=1586634 RepID=A0AAV8WXX3_9CUCU|nr:hypothetical protein NQ314_015777 [Rhamnusium bicolor]